MTHYGPRPAPGWPAPYGWPAPPRPGVPRPVLFALLGVVVVTLAAAGVLAAAGWVTAHRQVAYRVGDCVVVSASTGGELHAARAACDTDPSFTVAAMADHTGACASDGYDRFVPPSADAGTARLCLVPNLVVGHCYRLGVAVGVWNLVNCTGAEAATVKVTNRLDTDDARACAPDDQLPARTYPAPPRTYCLGMAA